MTCTAVKLHGGGSAIVCGSGSRPKRCKCGAVAQLLCDHDLGNGKTCDKPVCNSCTHRAGPGRDLCPKHAPPRASIECPYCHQQAPRTTGEFVYPHRPDLAAKQFFMCMRCDAYVGCHPNGSPMGRLADPQLRRARQFVHGLFDPLYQKAAEAYDGHDNGKLRNVARSRAYRWLADQMQIAIEKCHIAEFDVYQCREAYRILRDQRPTPVMIREWAKARKEVAA